MLHRRIPLSIGLRLFLGNLLVLAIGVVALGIVSQVQQPNYSGRITQKNLPPIFADPYQFSPIELR